ncbi:MAG: RlmE family RNA methyltransferase [Caulobacteraceae bacterium]
MVRRPVGGANSGRALAERLKTAKTRTASSQAWLERQINDPFAAEARAKGYRSRAALKLAELDDRFGLIRRGARIVDLGCAPGGWLQLVLERGAGRVVGIDLLPVEPIAGSTIVQGDLTYPASGSALLKALGGPPGLILSDMAPNTTGHRSTDHLRIVALIEATADFAQEALRPGGALVCKAFQGGETAAVIARLKRDFRSVRHAKPRASRAESSEVYLVATGFRGRP